MCRSIFCTPHRFTHPGIQCTYGAKVSRYASKMQNLIHTVSFLRSVTVRSTSFLHTISFIFCNTPATYRVKRHGVCAPHHVHLLLCAPLVIHLINLKDDLTQNRPTISFFYSMHVEEVQWNIMGVTGFNVHPPHHFICRLASLTLHLDTSFVAFL